MVVPLAVVTRRERGQALTEVAIVLPALTLLILGSLQAGLLGYAAMVAHEAAFRGVRAAAVASPAKRERVAKLEAAVAVAGAPGLSLAGVIVREPVARFPRAAAEVRRLEMVVRVGAPRLIPVRVAWVAEGRAILPMEPSW